MKNSHTLFKNLNSPEPSSGFEERVFSNLRRVQARNLRVRLAFLWFGVVSSVGILAMVGVFYQAALVQSEFWSLVGLLFSDATLVLGNGSDFFFSLLETFPLVPAIGIVGGLSALSLFLGLLTSLREKGMTLMPLGSRISV